MANNDKQCSQWLLYAELLVRQWSAMALKFEYEMVNAMAKTRLISWLPMLMVLSHCENVFLLIDPEVPHLNIIFHNYHYDK